MIRAALITLWAVLFIAPAPAGAQSGDCITALADAAGAARDGRWRDAIRVLEATRGRPECASLAAVQTFSLARAVEQVAADEPARACEALGLYREVLGHDPDPAVAQGAREGITRTDAACTCRLPSEDMRPGRWARAARKLEADIGRDICRPRRPALRLALAEVVEQLAVDAPKRACEAQALYEAAVADNPDRAAVMRAGAGARRMKLVCQTVAAPPTPGAVAPTDPLAEPSDPPPTRRRAPDRTAAWATTVGAAALLAGSGALFYLRGAALDERDAARSDYLDHFPDGDRDLLADAADRHQRAGEQAQIYEIAAWTAVGVGAALAATATWLWLDDGDTVSAAIGPGHAGVIVRF